MLVIAAAPYVPPTARPSGLDLEVGIHGLVVGRLTAGGFFRGAVATLETSPPFELSRLKARLFWLGRTPFRKGKNYKLKLATQEVECEIESIENVIDSSTLQSLARHQHEIFVGRHEVAELTLRTKRLVAFDAHNEIVSTGRFVIVDGFDVAGGGGGAVLQYARYGAPVHYADAQGSPDRL